MKFIPFTSYIISEGEKHCPLCGSENYQNISKWDRRFKKLKHVKCETCAFIRHHPLPNNEQLSDYYSKNYRKDYQNVGLSPSDRHIIKRKKEAQNRISKFPKNLSASASILDFGCGSGEFVASCQDLGYTASGFEPGESYANYAANEVGLDVKLGEWQNVNYDDKFDLISSFHVFEHLTDPVGALLKAKTWLKPDGYIFLETPNMSNALKKGFGSLHFAHTLGFSRYSMEYLGALVGLKVVKTINDYDIGIIFTPGKSRPLNAIAENARKDLDYWTNRTVNRQFFRYSISKLVGKRPKY
jgi:2-polyprenyl-3-methyl-5-hydroxy-6-metoxy-1,4-benzoquinol methylase